MRSRLLTGDEWWRALPLGATGDAVRILVARGVRAFGDGYVALLLPIYLVDLGFGTLAIGAIVTSTLIGTALLTLWIGWIANRYSRRLLLIVAAVLMTATGAGFAIVTDFWPLLVIAFVGTMNPTSGDASVFVPVGADGAHTHNRGAPANSAVRALQCHRLLRDSAGRARGGSSRPYNSADRLEPDIGHTADVWCLCGVGADRVAAISAAVFCSRDG
jgi:hypothetical protein